MRIGVVGSRRRNSKADRQLVFKLLDTWDGNQDELTIVSGGCKKGADRFAREWCKLRGVELVEHLPNMTPRPYHRIDAIQRYYERNRRIAEDCDTLIALVTECRTGGTENTVGHARRAGCVVALFGPDGKPIVEEVQT